MLVLLPVELAVSNVLAVLDVAFLVVGRDGVLTVLLEENLVPVFHQFDVD